MCWAHCLHSIHICHCTTSTMVMMMNHGSAVWAMIILIIILIIVMIFFCCVPMYRALEKRWSHWDDLENDPRWNADSFQFSPTSPQVIRAQIPQLASNKLQYNRLSTCGSVGGSSRSGSFRNNCALPRSEDQVEIKMPPAYTDLYTPASEGADSSPLGSPPAYYSKTPSPEERSQPPQVVLEVATPTPPPTAPVKKSYRKIKKVPAPTQAEK